MPSERQITYRVWLPDGERLARGPNNRILTVHEVEGLAAIYWPPTEVIHARQVAFLESGFETGAWAYKGEDSRGLWQLNVEAHPELSAFNLFDPQINAYFAHKLWSEQGWHPWSTAKVLGFV